MSEEAPANVRVLVRVRPLSDAEKSHGRAGASILTLGGGGGGGGGGSGGLAAAAAAPMDFGQAAGGGSGGTAADAPALLLEL